MHWLASKLHPYDEPYLLSVDQDRAQPAKNCVQTALGDDWVLNVMQHDHGSSPSRGVRQCQEQEESEERLHDAASLELNRMAAELRRVPWLPTDFVALLLMHKVTLDTAMELTDNDLRTHFYIKDATLRKRIVSYFRLCRTVQETARHEEDERRERGW